jgi:hypothetical protein
MIHHRPLIFRARGQIQDSYTVSTKLILDACLLKSQLYKATLTSSKQLLELIHSIALPLETSGRDPEAFG